MPNKVTLTFAGDTSSVESGFARAGGAATKMGKAAEESASGFARAGEAADAGERKAMGFADSIDGSIGVFQGFGQVMQGDVTGGLISVGRGIADLSGGFADFLIPALEKSRIATLAKAGADRVAAAGARAWAAAQWVMNASLLASPITWVIVGIVALVAVIVLIATRTRWFQAAWSATWGVVRAAAANAWAFIRQIPGWIGSAFAGVASTISAPFRAAFNFIADAWNNTVGGLSFTVPGWVPVIGGNSFGVPQLPHFHAGGVVPGAPGTTVVAALQAGERIGSTASGGDGMVIVLKIGDATLGEVLVDPIRNLVRTRGGNVQAVLGQ